MDLPIEYKIQKTSIKDLLTFHNIDLISSYCKQCPHYSNIWTCPELSIDPLTYLNQFNYVYIIGAKVCYSNLSGDLKEYIDSEKDISKIVNTIYNNTRQIFDEKMFSLEQAYPTSTALLAGRCLLCNECQRIDNKPCIYPHKLRYSLEALGMDVSKLTENYLQEKILWSKNSLPQYSILISALLTRDEIELNTL